MVVFYCFISDLLFILFIMLNLDGWYRFFYFSHFCLQTLARNLKSSMLSVAIVPLAEAVTVFHIITQPTIGKWSIVMSVFVRLRHPKTP